MFADLLIDFDMDVYEVNETDEYVLVEVELTSQIERDIELLLVTRDGRASGEIYIARLYIYERLSIA